jgi:uncharacterized protein
MNYRAAKQYILKQLRSHLSADLTYHGLHHTLDVLRVATALCRAEGVRGKSIILVKTAAMFHDAGFVKNVHAGHEQEGCELARRILPAFDYSENDIEQICGMIMATKIPQSPSNLLEQIICDADLDYLGRNDFHKIANSLFRELNAYQLISDEVTWNRIQVSFLNAHRYHTQTNQRQREPVKQAYLAALEALVMSY